MKYFLIHRYCDNSNLNVSVHSKTPNSGEYISQGNVNKQPCDKEYCTTNFSNAAYDILFKVKAKIKILIK